MPVKSMPAEWVKWLDRMHDQQIDDNPGLTDRSLRDTRSTMGTVLRLLQSKGIPTDPAKIGPQEFNEFYKAVLEKDLAVSTCKSYENALKVFVRSSGNYSIDKKKLSWSQDTRPNALWLEKHQYRKLIRTQLNTEQLMLIHLELFLGLRRVDSIRLEVGFIDWDKGKLHVLGKGHGNGKKRDVDFNENDKPLYNTRSIFERYMDYRDAMVKTTLARNPSAVEPKKLLIYSTGDNLGSFSEDGVAIDNRMKDIGELAGVSFSNHTLRRTFGRTLYFNGVKVEKLAAILGHDDPKMTVRYLGLDKKGHKKAISKLDFDEDFDEDEDE